MAQFKSLRNRIEYRFYCWKLDRKLKKDKKILDQAFGDSLSQSYDTLTLDKLPVKTIGLTISALLLFWALSQFVTYMSRHRVFSLAFGSRNSGEEITTALPPPEQGKTERQSVSVSWWQFPDTVLVADKTAKILTVYQRDDDDYTVLRQFPIATGQQDGDKLTQGDKRTPEGYYYIVDVTAGPREGELYGSWIFKLNYPNKKDQSAGKTGDGIWIHGVQLGSDITYTKGCISLRNKDIWELRNYARIGVPVFISSGSIAASDLDKFLREEYFGSLADYMTPQAYLALNSVSRLQNAEKEGMAFLNKESLWVAAKTQDSLKKLSEPVVAQTAQPAAPPAPEPAPAPPAENPAEKAKSELKASIEKWRSAWESRNVKSYGQYYHSSFEDRNGMARSDFLNKKQRIFSSKETISVSISGIKFTPKGSNEMQVSFIQKYRAFDGRSWQDLNSPKTQIWKRDRDQSWKLIRE